MCVCVVACCIYSFRMHLIGWPAPPQLALAVMSHAELKLIIAMQHNLLCHTAGHKQGRSWKGMGMGVKNPGMGVT